MNQIINYARQHEESYRKITDILSLVESNINCICHTHNYFLLYQSCSQIVATTSVCNFEFNHFLCFKFSLHLFNNNVIY